MVVAAHYDVHGNQPGADDNGSGVAGLLELARLIQATKPAVDYTIEFLACPLEERSFLKEPFRSRHLGSLMYAKHLSGTGATVKAMISLEMIGYFTDKPKSQRYPLFFFRWFYPDKGNYIAVVGKWGQGSLVNRVRKAMAKGANLPVESVSAPSFVPGIDFSDHQSFWRAGFPALMVTDTAFYRNPNYHKATDRMETLDFEKMAEVVKGVYRAVTGF